MKYFCYWDHDITILNHDYFLNPSMPYLSEANNPLELKPMC